LAVQECRKSPRANQANAVVIPQVGQRRRVRVAKGHAPSPSCVWVPNPRGSGVNPRAIVSTLITPTAPASIK
jgi:hypothetical protein